MTNFQANPETNRLRWLTPERAVLVLPFVAGLVASLALASTVLTPLSLSVKEKQQQVDDLRALRDELPLLQSQLNASNLQLKQRREQQRDLLNLVAGVSELDTFLAELNDLADQIGVNITRAEPGEIELYQPQALPVGDGAASPPAAAGGEGTASSDPLLREGLERRSAQLGVSGSFTQLLTFMRALERLQVFVEISDLSLIQSSSSAQQDDQLPKSSLELALTLSAYGRQADLAKNGVKIQ